MEATDIMIYSKYFIKFSAIIVFFGLLLSSFSFAQSQSPPTVGCGCSPPMPKRFLVFFKAKQADLSSGALAIVAEAAHAARHEKGAFLTVQGYTSSKHKTNADMLLSRRRADNVVDVLVADGVSKRQITVKTTGAFPLVRNAPKALIRYNRRAQIVIYAPTK
ncbi:OmpA family protein [Acidiphilium acidophilum]|uniref:OmpA family protein n=1 Tax=Acidiphilium acidophilum TaxID=76588 RepID=UPI002E8E7679|nr:OmpA family protein [Acidiphilium acidophilum]